MYILVLIYIYLISIELQSSLTFQLKVNTFGGVFDRHFSGQFGKLYRRRREYKNMKSVIFCLII